MELLFGVFGAVALLTLVTRTVAVRKGRHRLVTALFVGGIAVGVLGPVSKSTPVAPLLDGLLGPNANWLMADAFFAVSLTVATWWADVMADPDLRKTPARKALRRLLLQKRSLALAAVVCLMVAGTHDPLWPILEVGSTDLIGAGAVLLLARLAYHVLTIWALIYVARAINRYRAHLAARREYIRYSTPILGLLIATYAPMIQIVAELLSFFAGLTLFHTWLILVSGVQALAFAVIGLSALPRKWVYTAIDFYLSRWELARGKRALVKVHRQLCPGGDEVDKPDALLSDIRTVLVSQGFDPQTSLPAAGRCSEGWRQAQASVRAVIHGEPLETPPGLPRDQAGLARLCASVTRGL